jgi:hypothetical protein
VFQSVAENRISVTGCDRLMSVMFFSSSVRVAFVNTWRSWIHGASAAYVATPSFRTSTT